MSPRYRTKEISKKICGESVTIYIDNNGEFSAYVAGESFKADTLAAVVTQARKAIQKTRLRVEIPATLWEHYKNEGTRWNVKVKRETGVPVLIIGYSPRGHAILERADDGTKIEYERFGRYVLYKRMSPDDVKTLQTLEREARIAEEKLSSFKEKWTIGDVEKIVMKAIDAKAGEVNEDPEDVEDPR